ncbi:MAG: hypothetical protein KJ645_03755 [Planctomycetes bacterium]|nr:hypothetical protein [Planctomycetota bacterium]
MRFSLVGVSLVMAGILILAVIITSLYRQHTGQDRGKNLVLVMLHSEDSQGLQESLKGDYSPTIRAWTAQGVEFMNCIASSSWVPSTMASMITGLYPSEHGLHRGHAYLTQEAETLAEKLGRGSCWTFAAISKDSLLEPLNLLQGFQGVKIVPPRETVTALSRFMDELPEYRSFFAFVEVDLDAFGGPRLVDKVLSILFERLGGDRFLENGVLALVAPGLSYTAGDPNGQSFDPRIPVLLLGKPLNIGPGKCVLKNVSVCDVAGALTSVVQGQGFNIRDGDRSGKPAVFEDVSLVMNQPQGEVVNPPPYYLRALWFDDQPKGYLLPGHGPIRELSWEGPGSIIKREAYGQIRQRLDTFVASRPPVSDLTVPQCAGPRLTQKWAAALGEAWHRPEFHHQALHAVEHVRLAEALLVSGYAALAIGELQRAQAMDPDFPFALFTLARAYASIDPTGAVNYYRKFIEKYGDLSAQADRVKEAALFLQRSGK